MTALFHLHALLGGITWDPQIRGFAIVITAVLILPGSVYLLLATNMGARLGFLLAIAGMTGWIGTMAVIWMVYGIGLKGRDPSWKPREVITGQLSASTVGAVGGFPKGWKQLPPESPELADAQAAVDKLIVKPSGPPKEGQTASTAAKEFPPIFNSTDEYVRVGGYRKGGDNQLFTVKHHRFFFRHSAHWELVQVRPVLKQPDLGGTPAPAAPDVRQPVVSIVMVRDLGSIRFPPFVIALSSFLVFGITCNVLHRRDKEIWAREAAEKESAAEDRTPEPVNA